MTRLTRSRNNRLSLAILGAALGIIALLFIYLAHQMPINPEPGVESTIAFDWKIIRESIQDGQIEYGAGLYNPPWSVLFILPLGFLSLRVSYGLVMFLILLAMVLSVPRHRQLWRTVSAILLAILAFPVLRNMADGNLEFMTILGVLLLIYAYDHQQPYWLAVALLIATIKPQAVSLLLIVVAGYMLRHWSRGAIIRAALPVFIVVALAMIGWGEAWLEGLQTDSLNKGISLPVILELYDVPMLLVRIAQILILLLSLGLAFTGKWELTREKVGMLIAASLLIAPYANSHSMTAILAIGIIPLVIYHPRIGLPVALLFHLPYIFLADKALYDHQQTYWMVLMVIGWLVLSGLVYRQANLSRTAQRHSIE